MAPKKTRSQKALLSRQEIAVRKRVISDQKLQSDGNARRVIVGIFTLAFSLLILLALATFESRDGIRGRYHNAIGPAGHFMASQVHQFLGICAYLLPLCGIYASLVLLIGSRAKRRWPQQAAGGLLALSTAVLAQLALADRPGWGDAPGGWIGASLADLLSGLFSTVGTVILLIAVSMVAMIIGTQLGFLRICALTWRASLKAGAWIGTFSLGLWRSQLASLQKRRELSAQAKLEDAAFIAQLEADEDELAQAEQDALEAEEMAETAVRLAKEAQAAKLPTLPENAAPMPGPAIPSGEPAWAASLSARDFGEPPRARAESDRRRQERKLPQIVTPPGPAAPPENLPQTPIAETDDSTFLKAPSPATAPTAAPAPSAAPAVARTPLIIEPKPPPTPSKRKEQEQFEFVGNRRSFTPPPLDVLECDKTERSALDKDAFLSTADKLTAKLADFGIVGEVVEIRPGPVVTMYEFLPGPGIKLSKIASLADDLAMAMEAMRVRIVAPIPGKGVVGIEVPNRDRETVYLKEIAEQDVFLRSSSKLTMCLGKDIEGMPYVLDLARAPHLLIAGTTGSGKSVAVNSMIMSILLKSTPEEVRFLMVDPKMLELSAYEGIPHLLLPVVTDPKKAALALRWAVEEMERRYQVLSDAGVRNIAGYNKLVETSPASAKEPLRLSGSRAKSSPDPAPPAAPARKMLVVDVAEGESEDQALERAKQVESIGVPAPNQAPEGIREPLSPGFRAEAEASEASGAGLSSAERKELKKLPYIVVIIDELADLMMVAPREVETYVTRLAQMARAAGIHLMVATQRPSTDVVTGVIKANFPTRISFMLRTKPDSMTILGTTGAEALLGMGDMLLMPPTSSNLERVHGAYVSEVEIKRAVEHLKSQGKPVFDDSILKPRGDEDEDGSVEDELSDELYDQALAAVSEMRQVSISMLQRKMRIGYNRAARMIERMERDGVVGPPDGAKPRDVLIRPLGEMPGAGAL